MFYILCHNRSSIDTTLKEKFTFCQYENCIYVKTTKKSDFSALKRDFI